MRDGAASARVRRAFGEYPSLCAEAGKRYTDALLERERDDWLGHVPHWMRRGTVSCLYFGKLFQDQQHEFAEQYGFDKNRFTIDHIIGGPAFVTGQYALLSAGVFGDAEYGVYGGLLLSGMNSAYRAVYTSLTGKAHGFVGVSSLTIASMTEMYTRAEAFTNGAQVALENSGIPELYTNGTREHHDETV